MSESVFFPCLAGFCVPSPSPLEPLCCSIGTIVDDSSGLEAVAEDADGVFGVVPIGIHREMCEGLLPLGGFAHNVGHIISAECAEALANQCGVVTPVNKGELLNVVGVTVVDVTPILHDRLLGVVFVQVLAVNEAGLADSDDVAVVLPEGNPLDSSFFQTQPKRNVEGLS